MFFRFDEKSFKSQQKDVLKIHLMFMKVCLLHNWRNNSRNGFAGSRKLPLQDPEKVLWDSIKPFWDPGKTSQDPKKLVEELIKTFAGS